jgi:hypothetical protein
MSMMACVVVICFQLDFLTCAPVLRFQYFQESAALLHGCSATQGTDLLLEVLSLPSPNPRDKDFLLLNLVPIISTVMYLKTRHMFFLF